METERGSIIVGEWLVEPQLNRLRRGEEEVRIEPRSMEVLGILVRHPKEVLSKAQILEAVWGDQVVSEESLTHAVWELRKALGDDARSPRYIQTIPKRGYRLIAAVSPVEPEARPNSEPEATVLDFPEEPPRPEAPHRSWRSKVGWRTGGWLSVGVSLILALFLSFENLWDQPSRQVMIRVVPSSCSNLCNDAEELAASIEDELAQRLRGLSGFPLLSRSTSEDYLGASVKRIASRKVADYLVDVRVVETGNAESPLRVDLELVLAAEDRVLWRRSPPVNGVEILTPVFSKLALDIAKVLLPLEPDAELDLQVFEDYLAILSLESSSVQATDGSPSGTMTPAVHAYEKGLKNARLESFETDRLQKALELFEYAVKQDPQFHQAWIRIAKIRAKLCFNGFSDREVLKSAYAAIDQAARHGAPEQEIQIAKAYYLYYGERDYSGALKVLREVHEKRPADTEVLGLLAYLHRRFGNLKEASDLLREVLVFEPQNANVWSVLGETLHAQRRFQEAAESYQEALDIDPRNVISRGEAALNHFAMTGSAPAAQDILASHPHRQVDGLLLYSMPLLLYESRYQSAKLLYSESVNTSDPLVRFQASWALIIAFRELGLEADARRQAEELCLFMEEKVRRNPGSKFFGGYLALTYAFLGRKDEARREIDQALALAQGDEFSGPRIRELEAKVLALIGDESRSFQILEELLEMQYQHCLTRNQLRRDPFWNPWREAFPPGLKETANG